MSDVKKVIEAMAALTKALGRVNATVSVFKDFTSVSLGCPDDATARVLADALNIPLSLTDNGEKEWIRGSGDIGDLSVFVFGERIRNVRHFLDELPANEDAPDDVIECGPACQMPLNFGDAA